MKTFITSMNKKLFDQYGRQFLHGWDLNAASDIELIVCFEGEINEIDSIDLNGKNYKVIPMRSEPQIFFLQKFGRLQEMRGINFLKSKDNENIKAAYNYRFDAIRFSFKVFSYFKCMELNLLKNDFAWIDADIVCKRPFCEADLEIFFPHHDQLASYLGRKAFPSPNAYSECGFIGYNFSHPLCMTFIGEMLETYLNGNFLLLKEWHDCMVFDYLRINFETEQRAAFKDLAANIPDSLDPFARSQLSAYFDHLKGPKRKAELQNQSTVFEAATV